MKREFTYSVSLDRECGELLEARARAIGSKSKATRLFIQEATGNASTLRHAIRNHLNNAILHTHLLQSRLLSQADKDDMEIIQRDLRDIALAVAKVTTS